MKEEFELAVLSDVHIKNENDPKIQVFTSLLQWLQEKGCKHLCLNGDIFDFFLASRYFEKKYQIFFDTLQSISQHTQIHFLQGNHEFFLDHSNLKNIQFITEDFKIFETSLGKIFVTHGDQFSPSSSYQNLRKILRSEGLFHLTRPLPGYLLDRLCIQVSKVSRFRNRNREHKLPHERILQVVSRAAEENRCPIAVVGHYHTPWSQSPSGYFSKVYGVDCWDNPNVLLFNSKVWRAHLDKDAKWKIVAPSPFLFTNSASSST